MQQEIMQALVGACKKVFDVDTDIEITRPDEQFGDFSTNIALRLAGELGKRPRDIAETLAIELRTHNLLAAVEVAGPGFINVRLTDDVLLKSLESEQAKPLSGKTVLVEYSDPNPFKPLHAGHLYTTLVGDMIARLIEHAGARTVRLNYGGDVGLHVAKSMWGIVQHLDGELPEKLHEIVEADRPAWLGARYVEGNNAYEDNESAKSEIVAYNKRVYLLQREGDHDSPFAQIYWTCRQWSYDYFAVLYQQLQVHAFDEFIPESTVTQLGVATVHKQLQEGVYRQSDGAVVFDGEAHGLHTRVFINSEGLPTYEAKEIGLLLTKWERYHFDESIVITANEQDQYMQVVLTSLAQYEPEVAQRTKHLVHGVVKLQGGVKMSSRKGNIVTALEILEAARKAGEETERNPSEEVILAAVKYAFAKARIGGDIAYDPKESIALEGNSGPYLQYAHARARSILAKSQTAAARPTDLEPAERSLVRAIGTFADVVQLATNERMPHHICTYLYELSQNFNRFYEHSQVLGSDREQSRLWIVDRYANTLRLGLELLGIHAPDTM